MPRNGSGSASLAEPAFVPNTPISSSAVNSDLSDIADMLTGSLARDGQGGMTSVLPLANTGFSYLTDPNTGMRRTAADTQAISAGGVDAVTITSTAVDVIGLKVAGSDVFPVPTAQIADKAVTLAKLYHPTATSRLLGSDSNAALVITGAAAAAGLIRLSVADTSTFATSQVKTVSDVVGTTEANGTWTITVVDATHIDLQGSTFTNAYVSGGTIGGGVEEISMGAGFAIVGSALTASIIIQPQGYLTLTSGTPIIAADVVAATSVFYALDKGNQINIYNGTSSVLTTFTELTLALVSNHLASNIYDCFVINDAGVIRLVTGPAWNTATPGSCVRGTGAGTTELQRRNGLWTNSVSMTARYGATTTTVAANQGTYVGSIFIDAVAGQVTCHRSWGKSRKWGVWNAYNRANIYMQEGDSTASWSSSTTYPTFAATNADATNVITTFTGLAEEQISCVYNQHGQQNAVNRAVYAAMGLNSTTTMSGSFGRFQGVGSDNRQSTTAFATIQPALGVNNIQALNASDGVTVGYSGTQPFMQMTTTYRG